MSLALPSHRVWVLRYSSTNTESCFSLPKNNQNKPDKPPKSERKNRRKQVQEMVGSSSPYRHRVEVCLRLDASASRNLVRHSQGESPAPVIVSFLDLH